MLQHWHFFYSKFKFQNNYKKYSTLYKTTIDISLYLKELCCEHAHISQLWTGCWSMNSLYITQCLDCWNKKVLLSLDAKINIYCAVPETFSDKKVNGTLHNSSFIWPFSFVFWDNDCVWKRSDFNLFWTQFAKK